MSTITTLREYREELSKVAFKEECKLYDLHESFYNGKIPSTNDFYKWKQLQRDKYANNKLTDYEIECLNEIGFHFVAPSYWEEKFYEYTLFVDKNERLPRPSDGSIYVWYRNQITNHRSGKLKKDKLYMLKSVGFPIEDARRKEKVNS